RTRTTARRSTPTTRRTSSRSPSGPRRSRSAWTAGRTCGAPATRTGPRPGPRSRAEAPMVTTGPARERMATAGPPRGRGLVRRASATLHRLRRVRLAALLPARLGWLLVVYLGSLAVLLAAAFWTTDPFTSNVVHTFTWDNLRQIAASPVYRAVALRTVGVALLVTVIDTALALPMAFYLAKVARRGPRRSLLVAILMALWASYLVKAYAWRLVLSEGGPLDWALRPFGLSGPGYGLAATCVVLAYLWLPYMILPIYAGLDQVPTAV